MFEKVNPMHPDKIADRIAGALVDMAYGLEKNPRIAVEVLIGHGACYIIAETSVKLDRDAVRKAVWRISGSENVEVSYTEVPQDAHLAENQEQKIRCGDNGIFRGVPATVEQRILTRIVGELYEQNPTDGKYIIDDACQPRLIACQSNADSKKLREQILTTHWPYDDDSLQINPLGDWTGGINVDSGATNRKLGSDMGDAVTGGGLHGKDLSKADVSLNICAYLVAQEEHRQVEICCAIGDETVNGVPYGKMVNAARAYINEIGGFEKFAEWGLIRPEKSAKAENDDKKGAE